MSGSDRREHPRYDVSLRMQFRDLPSLQEEEVKNLSRGGALVIARGMRPIGTKIPVTLVHPVNGATLDLLAEVKRVQPMPNGIWALGVQFIGFDQALKLKIHEFVDSVTGSQPAAPKPAASSGGKLAEYLGAAAREESSGAWREVVRNLDLALAVAPERADVHGWKARILGEKLGYAQVALPHAQRAAELDPKNEAYARMVREFAAKGGLTPQPAVQAPPDILAPASKPVTRRSFLPVNGGQWGLLGAAALALAAIGGYNAWFLWLRNASDAPETIDPEPYRAIVPLRSLKVDGARAFGVVEPGWKGDSAKVAELALALSKRGVTDVFLTDENAKLVATWRGGAAKVY